MHVLIIQEVRSIKAALRKYILSHMSCGSCQTSLAGRHADDCPALSSFLLLVWLGPE
jgi:hypothetical protein